jgi:DNA-directed RNA polymerase subunit L
VDVEIIESNKKELRVKLIGESHTFCNVLRTLLNEDEHVEKAEYTIEHPYLSDPIFHVVTDGKVNPKKALTAACDRLSRLSLEFKKEFSSAMGA